MNSCACPACQARLRLSDGVAGKKIRCPKCQHVFAVPAKQTADSRATPPSAPKPVLKPQTEVAARPATKNAPARMRRGDEYDDVEVVSRPKKKRSRNRKSNGPL